MKSNEVLDNEKQIVKQQHTPIFNYNNEIFEIQAEDFVKQFEEKWSSNNKIKKDEKFTFPNLFKQKKIDSKIKKHNLVNFGYSTLKAIYDIGIIQLNSDFAYKSDLRILLKRGSFAEKESIDDFYTINSAANKIILTANLSDSEYDFLIPILLTSLEHNVTYDKTASEALLSNELASINTTQGLIVARQIIINKG